MKTLIVLAVITGLLLAYALVGRDWLKAQPWAHGFFAFVEPIEIFLFKKSETILFARSLQALGGTLSALTWIGSIDVTPLLPLFPEQHAEMVRAFFSVLPLVLNALGAMVEWLRNRTTKPVDQVAVPDKVVAETPGLAQAIAKASDLKVEASAAIAVAVAEAKAA
jgi:hypothetical protein